MNLVDLERMHPEWAPWLGMVRPVLQEVDDKAWDDVVPKRAPSGEPRMPLLARAVLQPNGQVRRLFEKLRQCAADGGMPKMAGAGGGPRGAGLCAHAAFEAAINDDGAGLARIAAEIGADPDAFRAVAGLMAVPFLHACNRRWLSALPESWGEGYCPVCGSWPAFAEVCGVERRRYLRCGRCSSAWQTSCLSCPYCGTTDHEQLASFEAEGAPFKAAIEVCGRCRGYLKVLTRLTLSPPGQVVIDDLATVELDLAAASRDYKRPLGAGCSVGVSLAQA